MRATDSEPPPLPPGARRTARGDILAVCETREGLARRAADYLATLLARAIAREGRAVAALAGGSTPGPTYADLARRDLDWERVDLLLTDERLVPADHPDSNYRMIREHLGPVPRVWPMVPAHAPEPLDAGALARSYTHHISTLTPRRREHMPVLDVVLLGLGRDGHLASLFPGSPALDETHAWVVPAPGRAEVEGGSPRRRRLTLTLPILEAAEVVVFLVTGAEKADVLTGTLGGDGSLPASRLHKDTGSLLWFVDAAAGGDAGECME